MITRKDYLNDPEKWKGTQEEKEIVEECLDYIKNNKHFHFNFSKEEARLDPDTFEFKGLFENIGAKKKDTFCVILSRKVIEVYKNGGKNRKKQTR